MNRAGMFRSSTGSTIERYKNDSYSSYSIAYFDILYDLYNHLKKLIKSPELMELCVFTRFCHFMESPEYYNRIINKPVYTWLVEHGRELEQLYSSLSRSVILKATIDEWIIFVYTTSYHQNPLYINHDMTGWDTYTTDEEERDDVGVGDDVGDDADTTIDEYRVDEYTYDIDTYR
jgi:hypothetical protein